MTTLIVELPPLHPGQVAVDADPTRHKVIVAGRRWGKTRLAVRSCFRVALGDRWWRPGDHRPGRAWWVAPTYQVTDEGWEPMRAIARQIPGTKINLQRRRIELPNGGRIEVRSADRPELLVGAGLDLVVLDEAGRMKPEAWNTSLRPTLADRIGAAMFISTPKGFNWLYDLWRSVPDRPGWARFHRPSWDNPYLDRDEIAEARAELGSVMFDQEFAAEFVGLSGGVLDVDRLDTFDVRYVTDPDDPDGDPEAVYAAGGTVYRAADTTRTIIVDPALSKNTYADYTAIAAVAVTADRRILVLDMIRDRMAAYAILPAAEKLRQRWDAADIRIESTAFQASLVQDGQRRGLPVRRLRADRDKITRALPLAAALEAGRVFVRRDAPWITDLKAELRAFPEGAHDDQVDVLAYATRVDADRREWAAY